MKRFTAILISIIICFSISLAGDDAAKKQQQAAEALKALGLGMGANTGEQVEAIGWRDLAKLIPKEMDGMEAGKLDGGTYSFGGNTNSAVDDSMKQAYQMAAMAGSYSVVERTFVKKLESGNESKFTIRLMDSGMARGMLAPYIMAVEYDTPDGLLKSVEIAGLPAKLMQEFDDDLEVVTTQYMVLVNDRVLAQFEGNENFDPDNVKAEAEKFPFDSLVEMSKKKDKE